MLDDTHIDNERDTYFLLVRIDVILQPTRKPTLTQQACHDFKSSASRYEKSVLASSNRGLASLAVAATSDSGVPTTASRVKPTRS